MREYRDLARAALPAKLWLGIATTVLSDDVSFPVLIVPSGA